MTISMKPSIGIVGVGRMGANMARHLRDSDYNVTVVFDAYIPLAESVAQEIGASCAKQLSEVTCKADVILTVVSDDTAMKSIFAKDGDSLLIGAEGKTFINCATLSPELQMEMEGEILSAKANCLEASMASSIDQARTGTLYLMIGGQKEVFDAQSDLLEVLSTALRYVGPMGSASKVKALVNMVMNMNTAALAEGLGLGDALGLDLTMLREVFAQTGANSRVLETDADDMQERDHECYFSAAHAAKDSGIANALAEQVGVNVPVSQATQKQYEILIELERGELDKSAVSELTFKGRIK